MYDHRTGAGVVSYNHYDEPCSSEILFVYEEHQFLYSGQTFEEELMCNVQG